MYKPAAGNSRREIPYRALVNTIDPDNERGKHHEIEYAFSRRMFFGDSDRRGAFNNYLNAYPVGQPHGPPMFPVRADSVLFFADNSSELVLGHLITADMD